MGLRISVYRDASYKGDCTLNGISSKYSTLTVINAEGPFEPDENAPAVMLVANPYNSVVIKAVKDIDAKKWCMMGGNYAATSDSRFGQAIEKMTGQRFYGAVPIHDRIEG